MRAARIRSLRPLAASAAMLLVVIGSVFSLTRAGIQPNEAISSLNFPSDIAQQQFANREHKRIELRSSSVKLPQDIARQQFERLQLERGVIS
jgi:hypothetical protein